MKKSNLVLGSFLQALGTLVYVSIVVTFMSNGERIFGGGDDKIIGTMAVLMFFVVSAAVCSILVFGRTVILYLDNQKKEALKLLYFTIGWLALFIFAILLVAMLLY